MKPIVKYDFFLAIIEISFFLFFFLLFTPYAEHFYFIERYSELYTKY